jgi:low affinity Fe/Cu permease
MKQKHSSKFDAFSRWTARAAGSPFAFAASVLVILAWAALGPFFGFSDTWQLVINTSTTVVTFLMVFLIQNTQNRDTAAIQLKLDELIRATQGAHNALLDLEEIDDERFEQYRASYRRLAAEARKRLKSGRLDTNSPDIKDSAPR